MDLAESYLDVPYDQRWELLIPTIVNIYLEERVTIAQLAKRMVDDFSFKAEPHQYRYQFKKWGIKKRTTTVEKEAVISALGKRKRRQLDIGSSNVQLVQGDWLKPDDKKQRKRHINDSIHTEGPLYVRPGLFFNRTLPSSALFGVPRGHTHDNPSPLSNGPPTPAYLTVSSPQDQHADCSAQEGMSPTTQLVHKKVLMDRAQLLLAGRDMDLMKQMSRDERRATADWLHDFWMFSFVTTKYWGEGPKHWTLPLINVKTLAGVIDGSPKDHQNRSLEHEPTQPPSMATVGIEPPTQLCNWSIHIDFDDPEVESIFSQPSSPGSNDGDRNDGDQFDLEDESTWREWNEHHRDLTSTITQGLQDNVFTTYQAEDVPIAIDQIANTISESTKDAKVEAIGFAIMARSVALIDLLRERDFNREAFRAISPFHLAARFLDGSKACCAVMWKLVNALQNEMSVGVNYTDDLGMTVLDTLFMTILRSHSSVSPASLGIEFFAPSSNFEGVDVDICGRWDADSPCVRHLHATGNRTIPHEWKHVFCHTSAQAVCHCLTAIFMDVWAPNINTASGLFHRRCQSCRSELRVGPLHAFVLVCYHLASACRPGETLFGMLACLTCLLTLRADPSLSAEISFPAILGLEETETCQHQPFNAAELASAVPSAVVTAWTPEVKLGWEVIKEVLNHCVREAQANSVNTTGVSFSFSGIPSGVAYDDSECNGILAGPDSNGEYCQHNMHDVESDEVTIHVKCGDKRLGTIWAAIQVELLSYRRLEEEDPWLSPMFDMQGVIEGLRTNNDSTMKSLLDNRGKNALQRFSVCGLFSKAAIHPGCATREEACATYFSNLDDWNRTTFIQRRMYE